MAHSDYIYEYDRDKNNTIVVAREKCLSLKKHFHNCIELIYALDGEVEVHIDGDILQLTSGQFSTCAPFSTHYYNTTKNGDFFVVLIPRRYFRKYTSLFNVQSFFQPIQNDTDEKDLLRIIEMMKKLIKNQDFWGIPFSPETQFAQENLLQQLSIFLINICIHKCGLKQRHRISSLVADAVDIIEREFQKDLKVSDICKKIGCSQKDLSYHFKRTMGISILAYIEKTRIVDVAYNLLSDPNLTVEAAMLQAGFQSARTFLRHFKGVYGCTPSEYRKKGRSGILPLLK